MFFFFANWALPPEIACEELFLKKSCLTALLLLVFREIGSFVLLSVRSTMCTRRTKYQIFLARIFPSLVEWIEILRLQF